MFPALWNIGLQFLPWTYFFSTTSTTTPPSCFDTSSTLVALVSCFDTYTVPEGSYTNITYASAQPTVTQRAEWKDLVQSVLSVDNGNCGAVSIPSSLGSIYAVRSFQSYCVLYETTSSGGTYNKGWGFMVVPSFRSQIARRVHISAPHPKFDTGTVEQAAAIFQTTGSHSLLVTGRQRNAFIYESDCIPSYNITDPAHNIAEPFYDAIVVIHDWQNALDGCPSASCAFIQMHGKGSTTCESDTVFLSAGLGNSNSSKLWYTDSVDRPVKRIKSNVMLAFPSWTVSLPSDSNCNLTATKNVGGRYMNNVVNVCGTAGATPSTATGEFVHIEQASEARSAANYALWSQAVSDSFTAASVAAAAPYGSV